MASQGTLSAAQSEGPWLTSDSRWPLDHLWHTNQICIPNYPRCSELHPCSDNALFSNPSWTTISELDSSGSFRSHQMFNMSCCSPSRSAVGSPLFRAAYSLGRCFSFSQLLILYHPSIGNRPLFRQERLPEAACTRNLIYSPKQPTIRCSFKSRCSHFSGHISMQDLDNSSICGIDARSIFVR